MLAISEHLLHRPPLAIECPRSKIPTCISCAGGEFVYVKERREVRPTGAFLVSRAERERETGREDGQWPRWLRREVLESVEVPHPRRAGRASEGLRATTKRTRRLTHTRESAHAWVRCTYTSSVSARMFVPHV